MCTSWQIFASYNGIGFCPRVLPILPNTTDFTVFNFNNSFISLTGSIPKPNPQPVKNCPVKSTVMKPAGLFHRLAVIKSSQPIFAETSRADFLPRLSTPYPTEIPPIAAPTGTNAYKTNKERMRINAHCVRSKFSIVIVYRTTKIANIAPPSWSSARTPDHSAATARPRDPSLTTRHQSVIIWNYGHLFACASEVTVLWR